MTLEQFKTLAAAAQLHGDGDLDTIDVEELRGQRVLYAFIDNKSGEVQARLLDEEGRVI